MSRIEELCAALKAGGIEYLRDAPLSERCSFRIGGPAALIAQPSDEQGLMAAVALAGEFGYEYFLLGNGSNLLFEDEGYRGVVISTSGLRGMALDAGAGRLEAGCGLSLTQLALEAAKAGLAGADFLYGIPGSVGGGVYMNAGAYGSQLSDVLFKVRYFDAGRGELFERPAGELDFSYRHSAFMENRGWVILSATLGLGRGDRYDVEALMREHMACRRERQPLEYPSAGSVFKRRPGHFMGRIIEESDLKGYAVGGARVSEKHAGFIVNTGGARADDVKKLVGHIKETILKNYGFEPECEIIFVGQGGNA